MKIGMLILTVIFVLVTLVVIQRSNKRSASEGMSSETSHPLLEKIAARRGERSQKPTDSTVGEGEHEFSIAGNRKYLLYIPQDYANEVMPLVLFFHGGGGHMEQAAADYGWKEKADKEGIIVAFPNGSSRLPRQHLATWNAGSCCGYARDQKIDDISFTKQVIADIASKVSIDPDQIFATGMSNGGMMAHRLACEMADTFKAVASVAGTDGTLACTPSRPISVMHIHAKNDDHVLFGGGAGEGAFRDESVVTDFTSVDETIRRWVERNHAERTPKRVLEVPGAYADLYTSKKNSAQVEVVITETGGHSWPGGKPVRQKNPSKAIIANDIIWDFFKSQTR